MTERDQILKELRDLYIESYKKKNEERLRNLRDLYREYGARFGLQKYGRLFELK